MQISCKKKKHHSDFMLHSVVIRHLYLVSAMHLSSAEFHSVGW